MSLRLGRMMSDGIRRVVTPTGGILLLVFIALQLLIQSSINTMVVGFFPPGPATEIEVALGLTLPVSGTVAGLILAVSVVLSAVYIVVLARGFTRPLEELVTFPATLYTRRIGRASLSMLVAGILVWIAVFIGSLFLFIPGIFLAICFLLVIFAVGVEDRGILGALKRIRTRADSSARPLCSNRPRVRSPPLANVLAAGDVGSGGKSGYHLFFLPCRNQTG